MLASGFESGQLVGHGPIVRISEKQEVQFYDNPFSPLIYDTKLTQTKIDMVILATGYKEECIVEREDKLNGLFKIGFGNDNFLPLRSISDEAMNIAEEIVAGY